MAIYAWSTLTDAQQISFTPGVDTIVYDIADANWTALYWDWYNPGSGPVFVLNDGTKTVYFNGLDMSQFAADTLTFSSGTQFLVGDMLASSANDADGNHIVGGAAADVLYGMAGDDILDGGDGNDFLSGGPGNDVINGGAGFDYYMHSRNATTPLIVNLLSGRAYHDGYVDTLTGIEALRGGRGDDVLIGDAAANLLRGLAGSDYMDGGAGIDTVMLSDLFVVQGAVVNLATNRIANDGFGHLDYVFNVENIRGTHLADNITGDGLANLLEGLGANDTLNGGLGNDTLDGGLGNDILRGAAGNDLLKGSDGADKLEGGAGRDLLNGGLGADFFIFRALADSTPDANRDVVQDFKRAQGDKIDLSLIDADPGTAGNQAFTFIGTAAFVAGAATAQVRFDTATSTLYASTDSDAAAELSLKLTGLASMQASDLVL